MQGKVHLEEDGGSGARLDARHERPYSTARVLAHSEVSNRGYADFIALQLSHRETGRGTS
jgi:hypothetical protein